MTIPRQLNPDIVQVQYDLNMACLKTSVKLLDRLKLQPIDTNVAHDGDDLGHAISRLFIRYVQLLLGALELCQSDNLVRQYLVANRLTLTVCGSLRIAPLMPHLC